MLRYLAGVYRTLVKTVPKQAMDERLHDVRAYLHTLLATTDSSLLEEWEGRRRDGVSVLAGAEPEADLLADPAAFRARVRAELHALLRALAERRYDDAAQLVRQNPTDHWASERFEQSMAPFYEQHGGIRFDHEARLAEHQQIRPLGARRFEVLQVLLDPEGSHDWYLAGEIDLTRERQPLGPLIHLSRIGS